MHWVVPLVHRAAVQTAAHWASKFAVLRAAEKASWLAVSMAYHLVVRSDAKSGYCSAEQSVVLWAATKALHWVAL